MQTCKECQVLKPLSEFHARSASPTGYRSVCKACMKVKALARPKPIGVSPWRRSIKVRLMELKGNVCADCGGSFPPYAMDFDHRDPEKKEFPLSGYRYGWEKMLEEAEKCDLVCAICHRGRTHRQRCRGCEDC